MHQTYAIPTGGAWHNYESAKEAEVLALAAQAAIPDDYLLAALDPHEEPHAEGLTGDAVAPLLIVLRQPVVTVSANGDAGFATQPLALILVDKDLITITAGPLRLKNAFLTALDSASSASGLALNFIWQVLHQFVADTDVIAARTQEMEAKVGRSSHNTLLYEIMTLGKSLVFFGAALAGSQTVIDALMASEQHFTHEQDHWRLRRVAIEVREAVTLAHSTEAILDQYNTAISAVVANNLNLIMKVLTSVSIIMTIPTIVSGLWGQNTWLPFQDRAWGFWATILIAGVLCGLTAWWLKRKDYF
ncbi:magnesium transporter CorA family protein [Lacticaseibacillus daqingensis]|uniref:magnesium transporter CorA family protein n=1 Tax=Lacticaseibacillus daqingensis TaxID=2486014 RepID=UPI0013DD9756|nr:magnesium transporter CorA family protein [Lacticaseibacillus daqingensis]